MKSEQTKLDFDVKRQKTFTLDDVDYDADIDLNVTFIDKQDDLAEAIQWASYDHKELGFDIETRGLDPYQHEIIMFQFGTLHRQFVVDTRVVDIKPILPLLFSDETTIVGQNLKFEYGFVKHNYGISLDKVEDTMLQEQALYNGEKILYSLKALSKRYLNYEADKSIRQNFLVIGDKPFSKAEIIYGAYDVVLPLQISAEQKIALKEQGKEKLAKLEHEYMKVLGDIEYKGLYIDKEKWTALYEENLEGYAKAKKPLEDFIISEDLKPFIENQVDMFDTTRKSNILWSSSKQVVELFKYLGICPKAKSKQTKKLEYTVEAKVLKVSLLTINVDKSDKLKQFIKDFMKFKEYEQKVTTFGIKFFKHINPVTGRLHSNYKQIINTGRSSSSGPNLQNIPSDPRYRKCFTAPPGHKIVNADFSGQETVLLANMSKEPNMLKLLREGGDMHSFVTRYVFPEVKDLTDKEIKSQHKGKRQTSKAAGFAINYGGVGFTIATNLGISEEEGDRIYNAYFEAFPGLKPYFEGVIKKSLKDGYIDINRVSGRTFNHFLFKEIEKIKGNPYKKKELLRLESAIGRAALNYPVQGSAADVTKTASVYARKWLIENNLQDTVFITNVIHDEINVECPTPLTHLVAPALERCMEDGGKPWCKTIPLKAEAAIKDYWAH